jgi:hypothetical protein
MADVEAFADRIEWAVTADNWTGGTANRIYSDVVHWPTLWSATQKGRIHGAGYPTLSGKTPVTLSELEAMPEVAPHVAAFIQTNGDEPDLAAYEAIELENEVLKIEQEELTVAFDTAAAISEGGLGAALNPVISGGTIGARVLKSLDAGNAGTFWANSEVSSFVAEKIDAATASVLDTLTPSASATSLAYDAGELITEIAHSGFLYAGYKGFWVADSELGGDPLAGKYDSDGLRVMQKQLISFVPEYSSDIFGDTWMSKLVWCKATTYIANLEQHVDGTTPTMEGDVSLYLADISSNGANIIVHNDIPLVAWDTGLGGWKSYSVNATADGWEYS